MKGWETSLLILKRKDWERITLLTINTLISWKTDDDNKKVERILGLSHSQI